MKPIIGIIVREDHNPKYYLLNSEVCKSVIRCGGFPIGLVPHLSDIPFMVQLCDGFILPGGDFSTSFDASFMKLVRIANKPLLGICLGMQEMGLGPVRHMEKQNHKSTLKYVHYVDIIPNTLLFRIMNKRRIWVNSRHHDYLTTSKYIVSALSDDGIIESIEDKACKFFLGIQWHPETLIDTDVNSYRLFTYFIDKCKR